MLHATARVCSASVAQALAHIATGAGMARWNLGLWNCREVEPGLFTGESLFDGATGWVRVVVHAERALVDYLVGADQSALTLRIRASVIAGETLGHPAGSCVVAFEAWRTAGMDDDRWDCLVHTHETEIELIRAQLGANMPSQPLPSGVDRPTPLSVVRSPPTVRRSRSR